MGMDNMDNTDMDMGTTMEAADAVRVDPIPVREANRDAARVVGATTARLGRDGRRLRLRLRLHRRRNNADAAEAAAWAS